MCDKISVQIMFWCCLVCLLIPRVTVADPFADLEVHGFATQGFIKTTANSFFGDSEDGSFEFTELGVNATMQASPNVRLSGQLLSRRAGEMSDGSPNIDFAVADFSVFGSTDANVNLLAGRIKNPLGLFNDTRDVAFTRPGIFLPQTVYFQSVRSLALSADGVALRVNLFSDYGNLELQGGLGKPFVDENVEYTYLSTGFEGDYRPKGLSWIGRVLFETPDETWRFALSAASTSLDFQPEYGDMISPGTTNILYTIASGQYVERDWTFSAEYVLHPTKYQGFIGTPYSNAEMTMDGYYLQMTWHARRTLELMLRFEEGFIDRTDPDGAEFEAITGLPAHSRYTKAFVIGARWDPSPDIMLRAELQRNYGTLILSNRENRDLFDRKSPWGMLSFAVSYRF